MASTSPLYMISFREAQKILQQNARSFGTEKITLEAADGRVLAEQIRADRDYPPFNRATMDGYALDGADLRSGIRRFEIIETVYAGAAATLPFRPGACYKIMTGAPVPPDVDMIIRREDTLEGEQDMEISGSGATRPFLNIARQGEDMQTGQTIIDGPCRCTPSIIGLLASLGKEELMVQRLPRLALVTTGNEVVPVGAVLSPVQIRNSNRWLLQSFLKRWQIIPAFYEHAPDDKTQLKAIIKNALQNDVVLLCGGVSAGDADHVPDVLNEAGVQCLFHKLAIKPGKPVWCGITEKGGVVIALPGNPFSCLTGFVLLIEPWLRACFGLPAEAIKGLPLATTKKKKNTP